MTSQLLEEVDEPVETPTAAPSGRGLGLLLTIGGGIGLIAAFTLLLEKIRLLEDPNYVPSCSINPVLSCGTVMKTEQAALFGFPNPVLGLIGFSIVVTLGVLLLSGSRLGRPVWQGLQVGVLAGIALVGFLVFQSLYRINALCPYCMVVWAVTIPIAWYVTVANLRTGAVPAPRRLVTAVADYHVLGLLLAYLLVVGLVLQRFWDYWSTLL